VSLPQHRGCYRLLLAEDNELNRQLIKAMLEQAGHQIVVVNDGAEAVRIAIRNEFDAILMDVHMPKMDGYAATRAIRNAKLGIPIIALTANALSDEAERCHEAGMNAHVPKPVNWPTLFTTIDRLVRGYRKDRSSKADNVDHRQIELSVPPSTSVLNEATLRLLRTSIGDENTVNFLKLFLLEARQRFGSEPKSREACSSMAEEAHSFGGSAAMLGFETLAAACAALHQAAFQDRPLADFLERGRRARDAALIRIEELVSGGDFIVPLCTTA
jgi:two-component system, sensor histidine kinase